MKGFDLSEFMKVVIDDLMFFVECLGINAVVSVVCGFFGVDKFNVGGVDLCFVVGVVIKGVVLYGVT